MAAFGEERTLCARSRLGPEPPLSGVRTCGRGRSMARPAYGQCLPCCAPSSSWPWRSWAFEQDATSRGSCSRAKGAEAQRISVARAAWVVLHVAIARKNCPELDTIGRYGGGFGPKS